MTLLEEIQQKCTPEEIASRDYDLIASKVSAGRVKQVPTEAGNGTILEVLGFEAGNALLDILMTQPVYRHVKPLVEQGRLRLDSQLTAAALMALVPAVLSSAQANALINKSYVPNPVTPATVAAALTGGI